MVLTPFSRVARLLIVAAAAVAALPGAAHAAGFGQPVVASGRDAVYATPLVATAPNGRTAVLYVRDFSRARRDASEFRAAIGPDAEHLGAPTTVAAGQRATSYSDTTSAQLFARPDGGFVACFRDSSQHRTSIDGCSIASPTGGFGPLKVVRRIARSENPSMEAVMRPDGSMVFLLGSYRESNRGTISKRADAVVTMSPTGELSAPRAFSRTEDELRYNTTSGATALADGTVAIPASIEDPSVKYGHRPAVRLIPAGSDQVGPVTAVSTERFDGWIDLAGGNELDVTFDLPPAPDADIFVYERRTVRRNADGVFGPALAFPGSQSAGIDGQSLLLPGGDALAVTARSETDPDDSDCFNQVVGEVATGGLALPGQPTPSTRLSDPAQIALYPNSAVLSDGTVVATWDNATLYGSSRLETAIRVPGAAAFAAPQVLPAVGYLGTATLSSGGTHATLAWLADAHKPTNASEIVVSALRTAGPHAAQAKLPRHPSAPCDE
jgi:hypothetical protein